MQKKPGQFRIGKTKRDHNSGAWARTKSNREERADWRQQSEKNRNQSNFPWNTCNGKRNRSRDNHGKQFTEYKGMK